MSREPAGSPGRTDCSFGVVVCTIGRLLPLERLLSSLEGQAWTDFTVAVCAQGNASEVRALVERFVERGLEIAFLETPRGLSLGRNLAEEALRRPVEFLLFPNDTTVFPPEYLENLAAALGDADAGCVTVVDRHGEKFVLPPSGTPLTRSNVWSIISPGLVFRQEAFRSIAGFDEQFGTGAVTPWQSGEETDLVLRLAACNRADRFVWLPDLIVHGVSDAEGLSARERRIKLRAYSRGHGRLLVRHGYSWRWRLRSLIAGATFGLRHREQYALLDGLWVLLGRIEGLLGRTIAGRGPAVTR